MDSCRKCEWFYQEVCFGDFRVGGTLWCTLFVEHNDEDD